MPRQLKPHGTRAAYEYHRDHGEPACQPCLQANNDYTTQLRRKLYNQQPRPNSLCDMCPDKDRTTCAYSATAPDMAPPGRLNAAKP